MKITNKSSRTIYVLMALLFVATAIAGFAPTSIGLITRVAAGQQTIPPFVVHFHAAAMSLWLLLLLAQSLLMYSQRSDLHKKLGLISFVLAPCIIISMYGVEMLTVGKSVFAANGAPPEQGAQFIQNASASLLVHGASYLFFPLFFLWAIFTRQKDKQTHKRMMVIATLVLMIPALGAYYRLPEYYLTSG